MERLMFVSMLVFVTLSETNALSLPVECQKKMCLNVECPNGYAVDENGCPSCNCQVSCPMSNCLFIRCVIKEIITDANGCKTCVCDRTCPMVDCLPETFCPHGYLNDSNGCQTCKCKQPECPLCPLRVCPNGYEIDANGCRTCQCKPHVCPMLKCKACPNGYELNAYGCQTCKCKCLPVACKCPYGTIWYVDQNGCSRCTCRPRPIGQPIEDTITPID